MQVVNKSDANNFIVEIPNAQLRLPLGNSFQQEKPLAGITQITVTNLDAKTVRVTVAGEKALPTVELFDDNVGLVFGISSQTTATSPQQPPQIRQAQQPGLQTQPTQPSASGNEPIELVVTGEQDGYRVPNASTATRTDTPLRDIPASIQVVPRQVLQDQKAVRLQDALQNDLENTVVLPSYFRTDAALYYKRNNWKFALNIKNLFDEKYYETSQGRDIIYPGAPLTVLGTISWEF